MKMSCGCEAWCIKGSILKLCLLIGWMKMFDILHEGAS